MWKKPSVEKPSFKKVNLESLSAKESLDTNGGATSLDGALIAPLMFMPPSHPAGIAAQAYIIKEKPVTASIVKEVSSLIVK